VASACLWVCWRSSVGGGDEAHSRLLDLADAHLMRHGSHGFSFRGLARIRELKPPAVHSHFRTKPELVVLTVHR